MGERRGQGRGVVQGAGECADANVATANHCLLCASRIMKNVKVLALFLFPAIRITKAGD